MVLDVDDDLDLLLGVGVRGDAGDPNLVDVLQAHVEVLGDVVVLGTWDVAELEVLEVDGHGVEIEGVAGLADQLELGADLEVLEGFAAVPEVETGDVEVGEVDASECLGILCFHLFRGLTILFHSQQSGWVLWLRLADLRMVFDPDVDIALRLKIEYLLHPVILCGYGGNV